MEFLVILVVAALLIRLIKYYFGPQASKGSSPLIISESRDDVRTGPRHASFRWLGPGQAFVCRGYSVDDGMVYVGERMRDFSGGNEACLIDPSLVVSPPGVSCETVRDSRPRYAKLSPEQRGAFLRWLGGGRFGAADPAWLFLFLYGLERRLFVDGPRGYLSAQERDDLVSEVRRLLAFYGDHRSFRGYCKNLLATEWALRGEYAEIPDWLDFTDRFCAESFNVVFALYVSRGQPIPAEIALQWLLLHPFHGLATPARRSPEDFQDLFLALYRERYGDGISINRNTSPLHVVYRGANPSLESGVKLRIPSLPDPFLLATPLKKIRSIADECIAKMPREEGVQPRSSSSAEGKDLLESLDDVHREFLARLSTKKTWMRSELLSVCESLSLFPDPSIDVLNAWGIKASGVSLIEDGNPLFVDIPLLQEIVVGERLEN